MAAPTYIADLVAQTLDTADTNVWVEPTGMTAGTVVSPETDFFIEGTGCAAKYMASGGTGLGALVRDNGSGVTIPTPGGFFIWIYPQGVNQLHNFANGGIRLIVGSSTANYYAWRVAGDDTIPYGGWTCWCIDPSAPTPVVDDGTGLDADYQVGTPTSTKQVFGAGVNQQVNAKGGVGFDVMRYGRGEMKIELGDDIGNGFATFAGAAAYNDGTSVRAGLFQAVPGGYLYKGLFLMGSATNAVDFRDSNASIVIEDTFRMTSDFNTIEIRNAGSRVDWTTVSVTALGTVARGNFLVTDNADVNIDACTFTNMGTFTLLAATAVINSTFRSCDTITAPGSNLSGTSVLTSRVAADAGAVVWNVATNPDGLLDNMTFSKGTNAHHAIDFGANLVSSITLRGCEFTGFGSTDDANDSTVRFLGSTNLTLSLVNCTVNGAAAADSNFSIDATSATITLSIDPVTTLINIKDPDGNNEAGVRVYLEAADASGDLPYQQSITSITRSGSGPGSTALVTFAAAHGLQSNEYLKLYGITDTNNQSDLSGAFQVTVTGTTTLTYPTETTGPTPYNGTLTGTGATIYGTTDASGNISSSRTYGANQPLTGYARKSDDGTTYFKPIDLDDTVNSATGLTINRRLIADGLV